MILRLPEKYAQVVRQAVNKGNLRERLQVDIKDDCRNALLKVEDVTLSAKIVDLPCIVECQKTVDNKTFYKSGDICQMLLVNENAMDVSEVERSQLIRKEKIEHKKVIYHHGVTPPAKNIRRKRFRKTAPKKIIDDPEVEKEVRRLLRADISAISVTTTIIYNNKPSTSNLSGLLSETMVTGVTDTRCDLSKVLDDTLTAVTPAGKQNNEEESKSFDKELMEMFQDLSSDEDADSSGDDQLGSVASKSLLAALKVSDTASSASQDAVFELETLDRKIKGLETEINRTTNSFLQKRLIDDLENLKRLRATKSSDID